MSQYLGLLVVLNDLSRLDGLLKTYLANDVRGCTILSSKGMTHTVLEGDDDPSHFPSIRPFVNLAREESKTLLIIDTPNEINRIVKITLEVVGDINKPDTGFMITFPIENAYGLSKQQSPSK
jgi:hypothetical protein